ncbi:hypothetical protein K2173_004906 [Erythroxylum novogranatense]|uniref:BHLH domain-containing protein n=1 Tax=Erythroxylum novogranatense TaxID=1862640 RepID=A0AAV8U8F9_9ROSI|nr:hypothetical protein K2173_004906 [Erythroxylum novogranatense]
MNTNGEDFMSHSFVMEKMQGYHHSLDLMKRLSESPDLQGDSWRSLTTGDDFMELVCENGQILVRGRSVPQLSAVWSRQKHETLPEQQLNSPKLSQTQLTKIVNLPNDSKLHQPDFKHHDKHSDLQTSSSLRPVVLLSSHDQPSGSTTIPVRGPRLPRPELETTNEKPPAGCSNPVQSTPNERTSRLRITKSKMELPSHEQSEAVFPQHDDEEEIEGDKKSEDWRSRRAKRKSREIHNLSEKRRRDKINKRIHALKDLLPSSSKVGKASVLDETIEYVKTLQLQLQLQFQMVSMGSGLFMSPAMFTSGMQSMQTPSLAQMSEMAVRMHMGVGCRPTSLVSSSPVFGLSGQRMSIPVPQPPFFPSIGRAFTHSIPVPRIPGIASVPSSSLKGSVQIGSSGVIHKGI